MRGNSTRGVVVVPGRGMIWPSMIVASVVLAGCGGAGAAAGAGAAPAPAVAEPALASTEGDVERTTFAEELNVVLLAMTRLPTGIYYRDMEEGTGTPATPGREVLVSYVANLPDGTEVDRTQPGARPLAFKLGEGIVIRGWDLGVRGMRVGGTRQLVVPARYAYGPRGTAKVPPNSVMVFVMRLDGVR